MSQIISDLLYTCAVMLVGALVTIGVLYTGLRLAAKAYVKEEAKRRRARKRRQPISWQTIGED